MIRKSCTNVSSDSYNGNEQSPKRFGLSAEGYELGSEMIGYDKMVWVVHTKNNRKVWVRKYNVSKITHEEPVIIEKDNEIIEVKQIEEPIEPPIIAQEVVENDEPNVKKVTDYNIFLKYTLDKMKLENTDKSVTNKMLFAKTTDEWKRLKKNPQELKIILDKIKQEKNYVN